MLYAIVQQDARRADRVWRETWVCREGREEVFELHVGSERVSGPCSGDGFELVGVLGHGALGKSYRQARRDFESESETFAASRSRSLHLGHVRYRASQPTPADYSHSNSPCPSQLATGVGLSIFPLFRLLGSSKE